MSINIDELIKLNDLATTASRRKRIIVLNPEQEYEGVEKFDDNIVYDKAKWKIPEEIKTLVEQLSQNSQLSNEDKILKIYEKLCKDYVYDDNLISYIKRVDIDSFVLPDWYGRDVDEEWERNREQHNRRVCYEVSRYLAKALEELFKENEDYNVTILWDKGLTHYFVALSCEDYSLTLDLDDFDNIKDLTRVKAGLTAEGIKILEDKKGKFNGALDRFNEGRSQDAIKKAEHDIVYYNDNSSTNTEGQASNQPKEPEDITFLKNVISILKDKYEIDSQGLYEYIKEIVDIKLGPEARKKVWKEIKGNSNDDIRYIRCLIIDVENQKYLIDVDKSIIRTFEKEEFNNEETEFIPYKELLDDELVNFRSKKANRYDGR